ncbi:SDR family oxidoreductase [Candidatus Pelagibacter sp.]|nr:SDR family oxidoreductase [Candidatus Pelagibacter sp.]MDB3903510.1 SDR family oxidoreductase [Candidatus Pelagibacter sp.]MDB9731498.1 SDR family oxidoreductase [Candidatus Pelagibacter sp.]MDC1049729.1 SDR family oxidoreductase [Candidatus Pelagibacter sp.]
MKILITGACGHIGSYFIENLYKIKKVKKAILIDNLKSNRFNSLFNNNKKNKVEFYLKDLNDIRSLDQFKGISIVFHFASMTNAEKSFGKEREMFSNNLNCLKTVIKFCENTNAKLVHLSSTSVYGKQTDLVDETCEKKYLKPQSPYAKIKIMEENILKKNTKLIKYNSFRFGTIAGVSRGIRFHTAVNSFCLNAAIGEKIKVYKTALHQYRPYLSLEDAFKLFKFCIDKNFFENDIYNVVSNNFTVNQIINKIKKLKKNIKISYVSSAIMNQLSYHVDKKKLSNRGLFLNSNLDRDVADTLNLFKNIK